jgi:hypothetical protein
MSRIVGRDWLQVDIREGAGSLPRNKSSRDINCSEKVRHHSKECIRISPCWNGSRWIRILDALRVEPPPRYYETSQISPVTSCFFIKDLSVNCMNSVCI